MKFENNNLLLKFEDVLGTYKSKEHGLKALSKYAHWFPLKTSPALAGVVADLIGDGHVQGGVKLRLDYTSKSKAGLERFGNELYDLFKVKGKVRDCKTNKYGSMNYGVNCKPLIRVLKLIGVPSGQKVLTKFSTPKWILKNQILFSRFVNRLFSCEGSIDIKSRCIDIKMYKSETLVGNGLKFFKEIKHYLDVYFNIKTTEPFLGNTFNLRKDGIRTRPIRLKIKNIESLIKFRDFIGIDDPDKMKRLKVITERHLNEMLILR